MGRLGTLLLCACWMAPSAALAGTITVASLDVPKVIGPSTTISSQLSLGGGYIDLTNLTVSLNIAFPFDPALDLALQDNLGNSIVLAATVGSTGTQANFTNTKFDDLAATPIASGGPPFFGSFQPQQSFASLLAAEAGQTITDFYLNVANSSGTFSGSLMSWSVSFDPAPAAVPEPATAGLLALALACLGLGSFRQR